MGRIEPREIPSPGRPSGKQLRSRKQTIVKTLSKMNHVGHSQWALLVVDSKGRATVDTSDAFQNYRNLWFSDDIIKEACSVTLAAVSQLKERKRQELEQNGGQLKEDPAEGEGATEEYDFEDDAEHEDDEGGLDSPKAERSQESPSIPKHMTHSSPPIPPYPFSPTTPRARKRSLQVSKTPLIKKRRRSSVNSKAAAVPVQRSDSTSGESNAVTNPQGITYRPLLISDEEAVTTFFETRFRQMQQLTCKVVAKAWIKVIEPKKQSHFPYNRGEESKPSWWPAGARHKEPDHLMKPERLLLLMTMLRCRRVPVSKLENATTEVAAHIEECRIGLLEEIYRVAKMEERWITGTLPRDACCYVAASAEKIVSNQKPPSPKPAENAGTSPTTSSNPGPTASSVGSGVATHGSVDSRSNSMGNSTRPPPGPSPTDATPPRGPQSNPFSIQRMQQSIQPLHTTMSYPQTFMSSAQPHEESYNMESQMPVASYYYNNRPAMYAPPNTGPPMIRRSQTMPTVPQQPYNQWSGQIPSVQVAGQLYSPYSPTTQSHPSSHNHPTHGHHPHAGSNPATPVSAPGYQTMQLPPPLPPIHHQHQHTALTSPAAHDLSVTVSEDRPQQYDATSRIASHLSHSHHPNVSFSEFLESPIPDRPYELGSVAEGRMGDEDVGIGVARTDGAGVAPHPK